MPEYICEKCTEVFHSMRTPRDCPNCHNKYVHLLPETPAYYFFSECQWCMYRFITKETPPENCVMCGATKGYLKRIPQEKVVICDYCGGIMFTQGHINSHYCVEKDRGQKWVNQIEELEKQYGKLN